MNSIIALTQDARRRTQRAEHRERSPACTNGCICNRLEISRDEKEILLLAAVVFVLLRSGADYMLLLAIMYVII